MIAHYPALYRDAHSEETTVIENDGKTRWMVVRGAVFTGERLKISSHQPLMMIRPSRHFPCIAAHYARACLNAIYQCQLPLTTKYWTDCSMCV
jgi:hypothetical protein